MGQFAYILLSAHVELHKCNTCFKPFWHFYPNVLQWPHYLYTEQKYKQHATIYTIFLSYSSYKEIRQLKCINEALIYGFYMSKNTDMHLLVTDTFKKGRGLDQKASHYLVWPLFALYSVTHLLRIELIRLLIVACGILSHGNWNTLLYT